jgi:hypothetical protein
MALAQADASGRAAQVVDDLAALALDRALAADAEVPEEGAVERQAARQRGDAEVDVVHERAHR